MLGTTLGVGGGTQRLDSLHKGMQAEWTQSARGNMLKRRRINKQFQEQSRSAEAQGGYRPLYLNTCNEGLFSRRGSFQIWGAFNRWHRRSSASLYYTFITAEAASQKVPWHQPPAVFAEMWDIWWVFVPFQCFYSLHLVWAALNGIKCLVYLIRLEPVRTGVYCCITT